MKTAIYSVANAINEINKYFNDAKFIRTWEENNLVEIVFKSQGKTWELLSTTDPIFNKENPYVIYEA
jgi:hypothetical protein